MAPGGAKLKTSHPLVPLGQKVVTPTLWAPPKTKMGSRRGQTQNFSSTGSIGSKSCDPNPLGASQNQKWAPGGAKTKTVGPLGRKVVTPNPPLSASHGAQRGVGATTFRPNDPPERLTALIGGLV